MSELSKATLTGAVKLKTSFNWPVMGIVAVFVAYIICVWVNDYRVKHASPSPPAVTTTK